MAVDARIFERSGVTPGGAHFDLCVKTWRDSGGKHRWARDDCISFLLDRKGVKQYPHRWWKARAAKIKEMLQCFALDLDALSLPARKSVLTKARIAGLGDEAMGEEDSADIRQSASLQTKVFVTLWTCLQFYLHGEEDRAICKEVLRIMFQTFLPASVLEENVFNVTPAVASLCAASDGATCPHLQACTAALSGRGSGDVSPHVCLCDLMARLYVGMSSCEALTVYGKAVIERLSDLFEEVWQQRTKPIYCDAFLDRLPERLDKKRGRAMDEDVKEAITAKLARGEVATASGYMRAAGQGERHHGEDRWMEAEMCEVQSRGWLVGKDAWTVCLSSDGARIGNPAEEIINVIAVMFSRRWDGSNSLWLPPIVPAWFNKAQGKIA